MPTHTEQYAFSKRINALLDIRNYHKQRGRQSALAKKANISQSSARKWLIGEAMPRLPHLQWLAEQFQCRIEWLHYGNGPISDRHAANAVAFQRQCQLNGWSLEALSQALQTAQLTPEVVLADLVLLEAGALMDDESLLSQVKPLLAHKKENSTHAKSAKRARTSKQAVSAMQKLETWYVDTDALAPRLTRGMPVLVDVACQSFLGEGVYRMTLDGELLLRRLQSAGADQYHLLTDNPIYANQVVQRGRVQILGKVMWIAA